MAEGWGAIFNVSRKWHYFRDGKSLCRRFMRLGGGTGLEPGNDHSPDNCATCKRKRLAETKTEGTAKNDVES